MSFSDDLPPPAAPLPDAAPASRSVRGTGRRLYGAIANRLGTAIMSGEYPPGSVLPAEIAFSGELGVSRGAYREAMQVLIAKGLVESRPKAGTRVLQPERWNLLDPDVLAWAFAGTPDINYVRSLFELRAIVEPAAARFAAERRTREDLRMMKDALAAMRRHTLATDQGQAADQTFHNAILEATENELLVSLSGSIGAAVRWTTIFKFRGHARPRDPMPQHRRLFDAIAAQDAAAARDATIVLLQQAHEDTARLLKA